MTSKSREWKAFLWVPPVATLAWYVLMLGMLTIANGRLRLRTDIMAMAIGAVILVLPIMIGVTVVLAIPAYLLLRRVSEVTFAITLAAGSTIGLGIGLVTYEPSLVSPVRSLLIGATAAAGWWIAAGKRLPWR